MQVDIEKPQDWSRRMKITVPADRVARERRTVASHIAKRVRIPGFRKGKVPSSVVEKQYGASIDQQTIERLVQSAYREALREQHISPISQAQVDNVEYQPGSELRFDVEFEVRPEITLNRLGGFTVKRPPSTVAEEDVERVVDRLREENASWSPVDAGHPESGDRVRVEITPLRGGPEQPEAREYEVVLGAGEILEEIDQAIRTLEPGREGEFTIELPEGAGEEEREHRIRLRLIALERPELPPADDAFAQQLGDFESLEVLRSKVREDLEAESKREADREIRRQLIQQVLEANPFEVPPSLVSEYLDSLMRPPDDAEPEEVAQAKEQARPAAEYAVRRMLVIERVAEMESLHATAEDVDARVGEIAEQNEMEAAEVRRQLARSGRLDALASDLTEQRVFDYLKSLSTIEKDAV